MPISSADLIALQTTLDVKSKDAFQNVVNNEWLKFAKRRDFSSRGWTIGVLSPAGVGKEWPKGEPRPFSKIYSTGKREDGIRYADSLPIDLDDFAIDQVLTLSDVIENLKISGQNLVEDKIFELITDNAVGLDGLPLFHTAHKWFKEDGTEIAGKSYSNDLTTTANAANPKWYLMNENSLTFGFRTDANFLMEYLGLNGQSSDTKFLYHEVKAGYFVIAIFKAGFAYNSVVSNEVLDEDSLRAAILHMTSIKNQNGRSLKNRPTTLLIPPSLEAAADRILKSSFNNGSDNVMKNRLEVVISEKLEA